jgi:ATP-dependent DNA helicase RecG
VDEQHRFGVLQRGILKKKGTNPDILVMTATPIPRTLAMTLFGDLSLSVIDELPPGRTPIETRIYYESRRKQVYDLIRSRDCPGRQVYVIYPLVEESEKSDLKAASQMAEHLQQEIFPGAAGIGLLHGRMKPDEKEAVMPPSRTRNWISWWQPP